MDPIFMADAARAVHLLGLALGLGFAIKADYFASRFVLRPISDYELASLYTYHRTISFGLALFWISGIALLWLRTGFVAENFSPKLMAKIAVVSLLTINAVLIGRYGLTTLRKSRNFRLGDLTFWRRLQLCTIGALSSASWVGALVLGVFQMMKTMPPIMMWETLGAIYLAAMIGALMIVLLAPAIGTTVVRPRKPLVIGQEYRMQNLQPAP